MSLPTVSPAPPAREMHGPVPLALQVLYGIGEVPITATMGLFGIYVLLFYNSVMGLDGTLAGIGVTAGLIFDAVLDPLIGFRSDASRLRLGRRQSFMLFGCLGMGPFFFALLSPPRALGTIPLFCWLLFSSMGFRICFAIYRIPYLSLGAELTLDYDQRTRVIAVRSLIGLGGMAAAATLPLLVFFRHLPGGPDPKLQYAGYPRMGLAFGALMTVAGLIAVWGTQSRRTFFEPPALDAVRSSHRRTYTEARAFLSGMWLFLKNPNFRALWIAFTLCSLSVVLNFTLNMHFLKWYAGLEDHRWLTAVQASFYTGAVVGVAAWIWIAKRGEKRNFFVISILGLIAILVLSALVVGRGHLFGTGRPAPLIAGNFAAGLFASALWVLPFSMMADVVDQDALTSGLRREGICFGIMNLGEKIASGFGLLLSGILLSRFIHLVPGREIQTPEAAARIGIAYGLVPGLFLGIAVFALLRFRINRRALADIQVALDA